MEVFRNISNTEGSGDELEHISMDMLQQKMLQNTTVEMIKSSDNQTAVNQTSSNSNPNLKQSEAKNGTEQRNPERCKANQNIA